METVSSLQSLVENKTKGLSIHQAEGRQFQTAADPRQEPCGGADGGPVQPVCNTFWAFAAGCTGCQESRV